MKKLLLFLLLTFGLINPSFAGVEDISLKCDNNGVILERWKAKGYQDYFPRVENGAGARYETDLLIIADSSNSVRVDLSAYFKYSDILKGTYRLKKEFTEYYYFEKNLKLNGKKGLAKLNINRFTGQITLSYEIAVDELFREFNDYYETGYKDYRIEAHSGGFYSNNWNICEKYQRMF